MFFCCWDVSLLPSTFCILVTYIIENSSVYNLCSFSSCQSLNSANIFFVKLENNLSKSSDERTPQFSLNTYIVLFF